MILNNYKKDPFAVGEDTGRPFLHNRQKEWTEGVFMKEDSQKNDQEFLTTGITNKKISWFFVVIVVFLSVLFFRAAYMQIIRGGYFGELAEGNRIRIKNIIPERGIFFDRDGEQLVENIPSFYIAITPADLPKNENERETVIQKISRLVDISKREINEALEKVPGFSYQPLVIKENVGHEDAILLNIESINLPGVAVEVGYQRKYLNSGNLLSLSHVLGYEGKISGDELKNNDYYIISDRVGKTGLEYSYEKEIRGVRGQKEVEINASGQEKKILAEVSTIPGNNVILSIDKDLQRKSEEILDKYLKLNHMSRGAVIAMDPRNGEILSLVSLPVFDDNDFASGISPIKYNELITNENHPLFNRAIKGEYPSGSTFKPIVAAAALEEELINRNMIFLSVGGLRIANLWWFPDWKAGGHGITNVEKALAESVNTFFYIIGGGYQDFAGLGVGKITEYAKKFGLGEKLGIDIPGESKGFLPSEEWKEEVKGEQWYIGDTYHYAIGQGDILVTPLQVVSWISTFANGGTLYKPHLVKEIDSSEGELLQSVEPKILNENFISQNNINIVRGGLRSAVLTGSARRLQDLPVSSAGKTGTAEWGTDKIPHAWFTAFAPYENAEIAIVVLVEEGVEGSGVSLSVANDILYWYFTAGKN